MYVLTAALFFSMHALLLPIVGGIISVYLRRQLLQLQNRPKIICSVTDKRHSSCKMHAYLIEQKITLSIKSSKYVHTFVSRIHTHAYTYTHVCIYKMKIMYEIIEFSLFISISLTLSIFLSIYLYIKKQLDQLFVLKLVI